MNAIPIKHRKMNDQSENETNQVKEVRARTKVTSKSIIENTNKNNYTSTFNR